MSAPPLIFFLAAVVVIEIIYFSLRVFTPTGAPSSTTKTPAERASWESASPSIGRGIVSNYQLQNHDPGPKRKTKGRHP